VSKREYAWTMEARRIGWCVAECIRSVQEVARSNRVAPIRELNTRTDECSIARPLFATMTTILTATGSGI